MDRVICVDRGCSIPLGTRGTIVGKHEPLKTSNDDNDESFKTISSDAQQGLIIMCDPITDIFEPKSNQTDDRNLTELTGSLAKLLGVNGKREQAVLQQKKAMPAPLRPKLVKLFPYQVINLSQGALTLRQDLKKTPMQPQIGINKSQLSNTNGTVIVSKSYAQSVQAGKTNSGVIRVLQKPSTIAGASTVTSKQADGKIQPLFPKEESSNAKQTLLWPPQPMNRSITVEQLFAQAGKTQNSRVAEVPKSEDSKPSNKQNSGKSPTKCETSAKLAAENKPSTGKGGSKRQPAFAELLNAATKNPHNSSKANATTKVFVNSSLQQKGRQKSDKNHNTSMSSDRQKSTSNKSQILDLLCQPKNMERVNTTAGSTKSQDATSRSTQVPNGYNHPSNSSSNNSSSYPVNAQIHHMVPIVGMGNHVPFSHPVVFMNPNQPQGYFVPTPYPVVMPGRNPMASAFIPQPAPFTTVPVQPAMFPPPPPPQHWTHNRNSNSRDNSNAVKRDREDKNQIIRQTKGSNLSNVFVPLQVARSMAGGEADSQNRQREQNLEPKVEVQSRRETVLDNLQAAAPESVESKSM